MNNLACKIQVQKIISDNITSPTGDFHLNEFDEGSFLLEMNKKFNIQPKENVENELLMNKIIKSSTIRVRGKISDKELNKDKFIKELFKNFEINEL